MGFFLVDFCFFEVGDLKRVLIMSFEVMVKDWFIFVKFIGNFSNFNMFVFFSVFKFVVIGNCVFVDCFVIEIVNLILFIVISGLLFVFLRIWVSFRFSCLWDVIVVMLIEFLICLCCLRMVSVIFSWLLVKLKFVLVLFIFSWVMMIFWVFIFMVLKFCRKYFFFYLL